MDVSAWLIKKQIKKKGLYLKAAYYILDLDIY